jgi:hypothetical protein
MYEIGGFTMEGFELGMEAQYSGIVESVRSMANEVTEAPMPAMNSLATATTVDLDANYGEQSAKAVSNSNLASGNSELVALMKKLISAVEDGKTITIDGREIGRTATDYINKETRRGSTPLLSY